MKPKWCFMSSYTVSEVQQGCQKPKACRITPTGSPGTGLTVVINEIIVYGINLNSLQRCTFSHSCQ
jgi:hypothetical protein